MHFLFQALESLAMDYTALKQLIIPGTNINNSLQTYEQQLMSNMDALDGN